MNISFKNDQKDAIHCSTVIFSGLVRYRRASPNVAYCSFAFNRKRCGSRCDNGSFRSKIQTFTIIVTVIVGGTTYTNVIFTVKISYISSKWNIPQKENIVFISVLCSIHYSITQWNCQRYGLILCSTHSTKLFFFPTFFCINSLYSHAEPKTIRFISRLNISLINFVLPIKSSTFHYADPFNHN